MKKRFLAYKRLYDHNIELPAFIELYEKDNPFVWAKDRRHYHRQYCNANRDRLNWAALIRSHSSDIAEMRIFLRKSVQVCYKKRRKFPYALQEVVGCSLVEFRKHIASQFKEGMNEYNYGEWELDHIIPIASADTCERVLELTHYSNYQPLWASENRRKAKKILPRPA